MNPEESFEAARVKTEVSDVIKSSFTDLRAKLFSAFCANDPNSKPNFEVMKTFVQLINQTENKIGEWQYCLPHFPENI